MNLNPEQLIIEYDPTYSDSDAFGKPVFCACCYGPVTYSPTAKAWFHMEGGKELGTIAREVTLYPLSRTKAVMPAPKDIASGFTVPKINGRSTQIRIL